MRPNAQIRGFTLIELMVVLVIVGILAAVAYPSYVSHLMRSRRASAVTALTAVVQAEERFRSNHGAYTADFGSTGLNLKITDITPHYNVAVAGVNDPPSLVSGYIATATPVAGGQQANDTKCAKLSIKLSGANLTYVAANAADGDTSSDCWPK